MITSPSSPITSVTWVIRRDPSLRAISHVRHNNRLAMTGIGVEAAIRDIDELQERLCGDPSNAEEFLVQGFNQKGHKLNHFLALGCYDLLLARWRRAFSSDRPVPQRLAVLKSLLELNSIIVRAELNSKVHLKCMVLRRI